MRPYPYAVALTLALAVAACRPGPAEWTTAEAPHNLTFDSAGARYVVTFAPGSARLSERNAAWLGGLAGRGAFLPSDRVTVAMGGNPRLAQARANTIAAELLRWGVVVSPSVSSAGSPDRAVIEVARHLVTLPNCPNWSKGAETDFTNLPSSNFGCANSVNLARMVAFPSDLVQGRPLGLAEGQPATAAVQRYLADKVQLPTPTALSPIPAAATAAPGAGGGAGAGGTGASTGSP